MQRFTQLYAELDETNRTNEKVAALERYFATAPAEDAAWALAYLIGNRQRRAVSGRRLREWVTEETGLPLWLVEESYSAVGDIAETMALLLEQVAPSISSSSHAANGKEKVGAREKVEGELGLADFIAKHVLPLGKLDEDEQRALVKKTWSMLTKEERFVYHKLITGAFRVGVGRTLVVRALASVAKIDKAAMAHRIMGQWQPDADAFRALLDPDTEQTDFTKPYPFYLAYQVDDNPADLGPIDEWQIEWKWDGIRGQLIKRQGEVLIWTRGEDLATNAYPEIVAVGAALPNGTVLDGEILAWQDGQPLSFAALQKRIGRKKITKKVLAESPVILLAYDILEWQGQDIREKPMTERRQILETLLSDLQEADPALSIERSTIVRASTWEEAAKTREESRARRAEGFMLKYKESAYGVGRKKGDWWKWKVDPFTVDAVMIYAQRGSGRRASLYSDYTFAVWRDSEDDNGDGRELVPFTKAYSGLTDAEIRQVDRWVRQNTNERFGPVRSVTPEHVFEIAFEGIQKSSRHKSGIALRFPRMLRWRKDKSIEEADTLDSLNVLLAEVG